MFVKSVIPILLDVVLLFAFVQAPSLHVHAHEATQRHVAAFLHTHVPHAEIPSGHTEWGDIDPDDDARFQSWMSMIPRDEGLAPVILAESYVTLPPRVVNTAQRTVVRPSAHDPPALNATIPRAPPV